MPKPIVTVLSVLVVVVVVFGAVGISMLADDNTPSNTRQSEPRPRTPAATDTSTQQESTDPEVIDWDEIRSNARDQFKLDYITYMDERLARLQQFFEDGVYKRNSENNVYVDREKFLSLSLPDQGALLFDAWLTIHGEDPWPLKRIRVVDDSRELITRYSFDEGPIDLD